MMERTILQYILIVILFIILPLNGIANNSAISSQSKRPNVLFIAIDDMNDWTTLFDKNNPIKTPNLIRLAERGCFFSQAYCVTPACAPSRAAIMSGLNPTTTGFYENIKGAFRIFLPDAVSLSEYFSDYGYSTWGGGKIYHPSHRGNEETDRSFQEFYPLIERWKSQEGELISGLSLPFWADFGVTTETMGDEFTVSEAKRIIQNPGQEPAFIAVGIFRPHLPHYAHPEDFANYPIESIAMPSMPWGDLEDVPEAGKIMAHREINRLKANLEQPAGSRGSLEHLVQSYQASSTFADKMIGEILDALDSSGKADNTIIVLWSDHGYHLGDKESISKFTLWEKANHVPFIIVAPGIIRPWTVRHSPVSLVNIYPTLLELAGLPPRNDLDGISLVPLMKNPDKKWDIPAITTMGRGNHAIRMNKWRYIQYYDGSEELYDTENDPWNTINLANNDKYHEIVKDLRGYLPKNEAPVPAAYGNSYKAPGRLENSEKNTLKNRPNIIFFMADDLGIGDTQVYHPGSCVETPNINRLAENGITFTAAHTPSAVCTPTRYGVLTGRYPWRDRAGGVAHGITDPLIKANQPTVAGFLKKQGYRTALFGKWHVGIRYAGDYMVIPPMVVDKMPDFSGPIVDGPLDHGFDYFFGVNGNFTKPHHADFFIENRRVLDNERILAKEEIHPGLNKIVSGYRSESWKPEELTRKVTEKAIGFINDHVTKYKNQPFYIHYVPNAIHAPFTPNDSLFGKAVKGTGGTCKDRGELIKEIDIMLGTLINCLGKHNILENTLIVFTSDNGAMPDPVSFSNGHLPNGHLSGCKGMILEGGTRVPYIVSYPAKLKSTGVENDVRIGLTDWFGSVIGLISGEYSTYKELIDSEDLSGLYLGETIPERSRALITDGGNKPIGQIKPHPITEGGRKSFHAVYKDNMKLIINKSTEIPEYLFDLKNDPGEHSNLIGEHPDLISELYAQYKNTVESVSERTTLQVP
jgi:arylsulfatase A-like enzyme